MEKKRPYETGPTDEKPTVVTGAGGFIGQAVIRALVNSGRRPRPLVRSRSGARALSATGADVSTGTVAQPGEALTGAGAVINLAYDFRVSGERNLRDFDALIEAMSAAGVPRLVHVSSIVVHDGWPAESLSETSPITGEAGTNSYSAAKIAMERSLERAVAEGRLESAVILRPTLVYGPGSRFWTVNVVERLRGGPILLPDAPEDLSADAPFGLCHCLHVDDLAEAVVQATIVPLSGVRAYLVSDPSPPSWQAFYQAHAGIIGTGAVMKKPYAELEQRLPPVSAGGTDTGPGLAARVSAIVRKVVGNETVERIGALLRKRQRDRNAEQAPDRFLFELYSSRGRIDVGRAQSELGFAPKVPLQTRMDEMADYLKTIS